ncbi:MAG TPA: hypothetical protein VFO17_09330 [Acidimicrobiia bacterium]|jgi:hypothetical protein|nr:hypothetical protein [Acidimicrobiia bacterium]
MTRVPLGGKVVVVVPSVVVVLAEEVVLVLLDVAGVGIVTEVPADTPVPAQPANSRASGSAFDLRRNLGTAALRV